MTTSALMTDTADIRAFILGGKATFTVVSPKTGTRFTYRVRRSVVDRAGFFYVDLLTGPENTADYSFIGSLRKGEGALMTFRHSPKSNVSWDAPSVVGFDWLTARLSYSRPLDPAKVEFWHSGKCSRCGRDLTDPESIARGLGPVCAEKALG